MWAHAVHPDGVNLEFRPLFRMTFPKDLSDLSRMAAPGKRLFRSWLLLGGILPVDYDDLTFAEVEPGRRFLERSRLFSQRLWEHERTIEPAPGGSLLTDRVHFEPVVRPLGSTYGRVFRGVFRWRHRNLRRRFGGGPA